MFSEAATEAGRDAERLTSCRECDGSISANEPDWYCATHGCRVVSHRYCLKQCLDCGQRFCADHACVMFGETRCYPCQARENAILAEDQNKEEETRQ